MPEPVLRKIAAVDHRNPNQILPEVLQLLSWATVSACQFYDSLPGYATGSAANKTDVGPNVPDSLIDHAEENEISHVGGMYRRNQLLKSRVRTSTQNN